MSIHRIQVLYTQRASLYQRCFVDFLQWEKVLDRFFQENNDLGSGMKILDAGCGTGSVTKVLYRLARQQGLEALTFHGFDLTPAMLDLFRDWMKREGIQDIELQQANVLDLEQQLPRAWAGYDLIVSSALLEYVPKEKLNDALSNLKRLLGENGHLLIFVTRRTWATRWIGAKWWGTNLFDQDELEADLQKVGFTRAEIKKLPANWDTFMLAVKASGSI